MTTRIHDNLVRGAIILILFIVLMFHALVTSAQSFRGHTSTPYKGFVTSFGTRTGTISSDIEKINASAVLQAGGQIGLVFGNAVVRSRVGLLGYYSSTQGAQGTMDLYTSNIAANFYPLACLSGRVSMLEPYITGTLDYDQYKFFGYYLYREPGSLNYSQTEAPYLGKVTQVNASAGIGLELRLKDEYDFIHLFSEVRYGHNLATKSRDAAFTGTTIGNQTSITIGVSFGMHR